MNRRTLIAALTSVAAFSLVAAAAAQTPDDYPNRPIRIIVPQAAGSGVDQQARVLAQKMGELWGQQGVVENRPGRQRHHRHGGRSQGRARRLHADLCSGQRGGDEHLHLQETPLRSGARFRADHADGRQSDGRGGQSGVRHQVDQGHRRAGEGQPRSAQLRLVRHRQHDPSDGRAAVDCRRYQDDACALSGADAGDHRRAERTDSARIHDDGRRDRSRGHRESSRSLPRSAGSATSSSPTRRRRPSSAIRAWSSRVGPACSRRPARRRTSSTGCMARWRRRLPRPTSRTRYCGRARRR